MFDFFKKKKTPELIIGSPVKGKTVPLSSVNDPTFSEGMLGKGAAILPSDGKIYAPADGTIETLFDTLHAFSLSTADGVEILVHVGLDTVKMGGDGFTGHVHSGDAVKKGDLILEIDLERSKLQDMIPVHLLLSVIQMTMEMSGDWITKRYSPVMM